MPATQSSEKPLEAIARISDNGASKVTKSYPGGRRTLTNFPETERTPSETIVSTDILHHSPSDIRDARTLTKTSGVQVPRSPSEPIVLSSTLSDHGTSDILRLSPRGRGGRGRGKGRGGRGRTLKTNSPEIERTPSETIIVPPRSQSETVSKRKEILIKRVCNLNCQEVCSMLFHDLNNVDIVMLFESKFNGGHLMSVINRIPELDGVCNTFDKVPRALLHEIVNWVNLLITDTRRSFPPRKIKLISFSIITYVQPLLNKLKGEYLNSITDWEMKINETKAEQQYLLKGLFKNHIEPDRIDLFNREQTFRGWNYHFNDLKIPEDKGSELISCLSEDNLVGRGSEFGRSMVAVIDLSSSGKTYSIFQLANSIPVGNTYSRFFVTTIMEGTEFFNMLVYFMQGGENRIDDMVSLFILTIHVTVKTLLDNVPTLTAINFLRFLRNGGDSCMTQIFETLVKNRKDTGISHINKLNNEMSRYIRELRVKLVFAFDESQTLLDYKDKDERTLFTSFYQYLRSYNSPVFLSTTFEISKVVRNVSTEGRRFIIPIIGSNEPWFLEDVERMLSRMFITELVKKHDEEMFYTVCYLLSGSPENISQFHISLLNIAKQQTNIAPVSLFKKALEKVVIYKEERCYVKMKQFIEDQSVMDRMYHLFTLIFGLECKFQDPSIKIELFHDFPMTYSQALIEKTIAFVVKKTKTSRIFEIVDPIISKSYMKIAMGEFKEQMWEFLASRLTKNANDFELFVAILLLFESERLKNQSVSESPLFLKTKEDFKNYHLNAQTFVKDRHLSKKIMKQNCHIPRVWFGQMASHYFVDTFVKHDDIVGPDGIFYLRDTNNDYTLVTCAMTLISDPVFDLKYPNKAKNMLKALIVDNIETDYSNVSNLTGRVPTINNYFGWIVAPNMKASDFTSNQLEILFTGSSQISECIENFKEVNYYGNMLKLWEKFNK